MNFKACNTDVNTLNCSEKMKINHICFYNDCIGFFNITNRRSLSNSFVRYVQLIQDQFSDLWCPSQMNRRSEIED